MVEAPTVKARRRRGSREAAVAAIGLAAFLAGCAPATVPGAPDVMPAQPVIGTAATAATPVVPSEPLPAITGAEEGFTIALEAFRCGELDAADRYARAVLDRYPDTAWSRRSLFLRGRALAAAGRTDDAAAVLL